MRPIRRFWLVLVPIALLTLLWWSTRSGDGAYVTREARPELAGPVGDPTAELVVGPSATSERADDGTRVAANAVEASPEVVGQAAVPVGLRVTGSVRHADGRPAARRYLKLEDALRVLRTTGTADDGSYSFQHLEPGCYWLTCEPDAYHPASARVVLTGLPRTVRQDLVLQRLLQLEVRMVTPIGRPLLAVLDERGARDRIPSAVATLEPLPGVLLRDEVAVGYFQKALSHEGARVGFLELYVPLPVVVHAVRGGRVLASQRLDAETRVLTLVVDPAKIPTELGTLRFRAVDALTRAPFSDGWVVLSDARAFKRSVRPDEGEYVYAGLEPGVYQLRTFFPGREATRVEVTIEAGETTDLGDLEPARATVIHGRVVGPDRAPIAGARLEVRVDGEAVAVLPELVVPFEAARRSATDGSFTIPGRSAGQHWVRVVPGSDLVSPFVAADTSAGGAEVVVTLAQPVRVALVPSGPECRGLTCELVDTNDLVYATRLAVGDAVLHVDVPPGPYELVVRGRAGREQRSPFTAFGETVELAIAPP